MGTLSYRRQRAGIDAARELADLLAGYDVHDARAADAQSCGALRSWAARLRPAFWGSSSRTGTAAG